MILNVGSDVGEHAEEGVIASGIISSMLIGAVYVAPLSIGSLSLLKRDVRKHHVKYALIAWIAAVVLSVGASILHSDVFMIASAGMLVLSSIALSAIGLTFAIKRLWYCRKSPSP